MTNKISTRQQRELALVTSLMIVTSTAAFSNNDRPILRACPQSSQHSRLHMSDEWKYLSQDSNTWSSMDDNYEQQEDWQEMMARKNDGSFWSEFEPSSDDETGVTDKVEVEEVEDADIWLDTLASISADEVEFNMAEAERAEKAREMQEWGFDEATIANTFGVAVDNSLEQEVQIEGFQGFLEDGYLDETDWKTVESHTKVEIDEDTGEPVRQQMVYVDEHTCIGCTNCAMIAQSTFYMNDEHGRARVFNQWGDDDETIAIAIETCPVDCIHYVPYDELKRLEVDRRDQNINFKARLVNQQEYGGGERIAGFTAPQKISGNLGSRCSNCPSRGCKNCPMFGIGKNPEFERKEEERKMNRERRRLEQMREDEKKSADL